jgi:hypothetical protein
LRIIAKGLAKRRGGAGGKAIVEVRDRRAIKLACGE